MDNRKAPNVWLPIVASSGGAALVLATASPAAHVLALTAIAGTWVLQVVRARSGREDAAAKEKTDDQRHAETSALVARVTTAAKDGIVELRHELDQVRTLLADAVQTLNVAFRGLDSESRTQEALMNDVIAAMAAGLGAAPGGDERELTINSFVENTSALLRMFVDICVQSSKQSLDTVSMIDEMAGQMDSIFSLLQNIRGIADQTNLLALNAAIEAARAGDAGRGFAVVADEVRNLSRNSNQFNEQIRSQVQEAKEAIGRTREIVGRAASQDMTALLTSKRKVDQMMERLASFESFLDTRVNEAAQVTGRIAGRTADAVRSLQFEDIVRQIIEHAAARIDRLEAFLEDATARMHRLEPDRLGDLHDELTHAVAAMAAATPAKPAVQRTMTTGNVELF